nr:uncharacterized protein LOC129267847 [Lytechinus pictus]
MALLNIRNKPTKGVNSSPTQRFLGRRTQILLPTTESLLKPRGHTISDLENLKKMQQRQAKYFDRHTKSHPDLRDGSVVRMKPFTTTNKKWTKATVAKRLDERSYELECNDKLYTRNREHLRACPTTKPDNFIPTTTYPEMVDRRRDEVPNQTQEPLPQPRSHADDASTTPCESPWLESQVPLRRSSRQRREPTRMKDFVKY